MYNSQQQNKIVSSFNLNCRKIFGLIKLYDMIFLGPNCSFFVCSGNDLNPVVELFFGQSNVEGVYEG